MKLRRELLKAIRIHLSKVNAKAPHTLPRGDAINSAFHHGYAQCASDILEFVKQNINSRNEEDPKNE